MKIFCLCSCDRVEVQQRVCWCWHDKRPSPASGQWCAHRDVRSTPHDPVCVPAKPRQAGLQNWEHFCILSLPQLISVLRKICFVIDGLQLAKHVKSMPGVVLKIDLLLNPFGFVCGEYSLWEKNVQFQFRPVIVKNLFIYIFCCCFEG